MFFRQCNTFVIDHGRVLDRSHARPDRILDSHGRVRMRFHAQSKVSGFVHRGLQFFHREFLRFRIAAMGQHGAAGKDLDVIGPVMHQLPNLLPHFPWTVSLSVAEIPGQCDIRRESGHSAGPAGDRHIRPGHIHARTLDRTLERSHPAWQHRSTPGRLLRRAPW